MHIDRDKRFSPSHTQVLEELLAKLEIEQITWSCDKKGNFYHVVFPLQSGAPCETTLHCLTELQIGIKYGSSVRYVYIYICRYMRA